MGRFYDPPHLVDMNIVGFGVACLDYLIKAEKPDLSGFSCISDFQTQGGGITGTSLAACSRLGASAKIITRLGDDDIGDEIIKSLVAEKIDVSDIIRIPGGKSLFSWILVDPQTGNRTIYCRKDIDVNCPISLIDFTSIDNADVLLLDDHWPEGARAAVAYANKKKVPVVCDVRLRPENYDLMKMVDYAVISDGYALKLSPKLDYNEALDSIINLGAKNAVITAGENGAYYKSTSEAGFIRAFKVDVIDTTGAGDVFHGAFAVGLAQGWKLDKSVTFASAVAAMKCTAFGGRQGIPDMQKALEFLGPDFEI